MHRRRFPRKTGFVPGNRLQLLESGTEYFPALEAAIDAATREIYLETYIYEHDRTGTRIGAALKRAAGRGVTTHLLIDGFGSRNLPQRVIDDLRAAGVQVLRYRPEVAGRRLRRHRLRRLHRKTALIDGRLAFVGGINIIDDVNTPGQVPPRFDYAVAVEGPLLAQIYPAVKRLWTMVAWSQLRRRRSRRYRGKLSTRPAGDTRAAFVVRDNLGHRRDIEVAYLGAIAAAREEIVIACAYFLPGVNFRRALAEAVARGVRVVLLLQGKVEYLLLHHATRALYGVLLDAGVEIHEYRKSFLHAKVAVIDGHWATVGSSNIDPFSLLLAREANVVAEDRDFAARLRASLGRAMEQGGAPVRAEHWRSRPLRQRLLSWLAYGLVRLLLGVSGYARGENGR